MRKGLTVEDVTKGDVSFKFMGWVQCFTIFINDVMCSEMSKFACFLWLET